MCLVKGIILAILAVNILTGELRASGAGRRVVCYYANWAVYRQGGARFTPQNINPYLCTHLIYAFGGLGKDDSIVPFDEYQDIEKGDEETSVDDVLQDFYFQVVMADLLLSRLTTKT